MLTGYVCTLQENPFREGKDLGVPAQRLVLVHDSAYIVLNIPSRAVKVRPMANIDFILTYVGKGRGGGGEGRGGRMRIAEREERYCGTPLM